MTGRKSCTWQHSDSQFNRLVGASRRRSRRYRHLWGLKGSTPATRRCFADLLASRDATDSIYWTRPYFPSGEAPAATKSMRIAIDDLGLKHLWIIYPGTERFPIDKHITAWPLRDVANLRGELQ